MHFSLRHQCSSGRLKQIRQVLGRRICVRTSLHHQLFSKRPSCFTPCQYKMLQFLVTTASNATEDGKVQLDTAGLAAARSHAMKHFRQKQRQRRSSTDEDVSLVRRSSCENTLFAYKLQGCTLPPAADQAAASSNAKAAPNKLSAEEEAYLLPCIARMYTVERSWKPEWKPN